MNRDRLHRTMVYLPLSLRSRALRLCGLKTPAMPMTELVREALEREVARREAAERREIARRSA